MQQKIIVETLLTKRESSRMVILFGAAGEWFAACSKRTSSESSSADVFRPKHGYGYDEEEHFDDCSTG